MGGIIVPPPTLLTLDVNLAKDLGAAGHSPDQVESEI